MMPFIPRAASSIGNLTTNNVLSENSGVLYLTIELSFSGATSWVDIGGVRLTLQHE